MEQSRCSVKRKYPKLSIYCLNIVCSAQTFPKYCKMSPKFHPNDVKKILNSISKFSKYCLMHSIYIVEIELK